MTNQIKTRKRVADHGEVFTSKREVEAMLEMVKHETERIDSRFLEPACGSGNFLVEILSRKLEIVSIQAIKNESIYELNSIIAISSIYGVELLEDNTVECRSRLFSIFEKKYTDLYKKITPQYLDAAKYILSQNIICGDAITLRSSTGLKPPLVFAEWSFIGSKVKRRDFTFDELLAFSPIDRPNLFSDSPDEFLIPTPIKSYPMVHFLKVCDQ